MAKHGASICFADWGSSENYDRLPCSSRRYDRDVLTPSPPRLATAVLLIRSKRVG